jgi:hypothetical protein
MPYVAVQHLIDPSYPARMCNYWTGDFLSGLPYEAIEVISRFHLAGEPACARGRVRTVSAPAGAGVRARLERLPRATDIAQPRRPPAPRRLAFGSHNISLQVGRDREEINRRALTVYG